MIRFWLVALAVFGCLVGSMLLVQPMHAQLAKGADVTGAWTGKYICGQGVTHLDLEIEKGPGKAITATFRFGPLPENPDVPRGAYRMTGTYDASLRHVQLEGVKWIDYPQNYIMVGLDGRMDADGGRIKGVVPTMSSCSSFEVKRPAELIS